MNLLIKIQFILKEFFLQEKLKIIIFIKNIILKFSILGKKVEFLVKIHLIFLLIVLMDYLNKNNKINSLKFKFRKKIIKK